MTQEETAVSVSAGSAVKRCPSCGRLIGDVEECPYCHARVYKRISIKALFIIVLIVLGGSGIALYLVPHGQPMYFKIGDLTEMNNYWHVAIEGTVVGRPYYSADYISFDVSDGTGTIRIRIKPSGMDAFLADPSMVPAIGDHIRIEGDARIRGDSKTLYVTRAEWVHLTRAAPVANVTVNDLILPYHNFSYINKKVWVTGIIADMDRYSDGGLKVKLIDPSFVIGLNTSPVPTWNENKQLVHYGLVLYIGGDHATLCHAQGIVGRIHSVQKITLLASVTEYDGYLELIPADFSTITVEDLWDYTTPVSTITSNAADYENRVVLVRGQINSVYDGPVPVGSTQSSVRYNITNDGSEIEIYAPGMIDEFVGTRAYPALYEEVLVIGYVSIYSSMVEIIPLSYASVYRNLSTEYVPYLSAEYHMKRITVKVTLSGNWTSVPYLYEISGTDSRGMSVTVAVLNGTIVAAAQEGITLPPAGVYYVTGIYDNSSGYLYITVGPEGYEMGPQ